MIHFALLLKILLFFVVVKYRIEIESLRRQLATYQQVRNIYMYRIRNEFLFFLSRNYDWK